MRTLCVVFALTITASIAHADDGFNNTPGWSDGGENGGVRYFHGDDGSNGWQSTSNGNSYYHSDKKNCWSNNGGVTQTSCVPY